MNGLGPGPLGNFNELIDSKVAVTGGRRADMIGLISIANVGGVAVGVGVNGNGFDAQFMAGANDTQGNFSPIGD
jgi:hypothetical protein